MSTATSYTKLGYLVIKKEATAGTALYPDQPIEILSESMKTDWAFTIVDSIAGNRSNNMRPVLDKVGVATGDFEIIVEPNNVGFFFNGAFGEDVVTTLTALTSLQHVWEPLNTLVTYTMDVKMAGEDYVSRYFGCRIEVLSFKIDGNKLVMTVTVQAQRSFTNARVTLAAASGTALLLDQTSGLTTSDTIQVLNDTDPSGAALAELTITTVTDENTLVVSTIGASLGVNDIVVIKAKTTGTTPEDYDMSNEFIWAGGAEVYIGTGANGIQNLATKTNVEDMELTFENGLEPRWAATGRDVVDRMPSTILLKGFKASGKIKQFHISPEMIDMLRQNEQASLRVQFLGSILQANTASAATAVLESSGAGTVTVTSVTTTDASNDYAIKVVQGTTTLSVALSGKLLTVTLDTDAADNAVATVAAAIDALAEFTAVSASTGNVTTTDNPDKVDFNNGRDASERQLLRFDMPDVRFRPFNANLTADGIIEEEIEFDCFRDANDDREVKVTLRNNQASY